MLYYVILCCIMLYIISSESQKPFLCKASWSRASVEAAAGAEAAAFLRRIGPKCPAMIRLPPLGLGFRV